MSSAIRPQIVLLGAIPCVRMQGQTLPESSHDVEWSDRLGELVSNLLSLNMPVAVIMAKVAISVGLGYVIESH